jgi:hypothetical protein
VWFWLRLLLAGSILFGSVSSYAQWVTQRMTLTNGWNAVYLHVDASHTDIPGVLAQDPASPILEVWQWRPAPSQQFIQDPQSPADSGSQWLSWTRVNPDISTLQRLVGNAAYLVRVPTNLPSYTWEVRGKALAPIYQWTSTGLNLLGFPTPVSNPPSFEQFLTPNPALRAQAEVYQYRGGDLDSDNPSEVLALRTTPVRRGQAFWIRSGSHFNNYFGPFEIVCGAQGVDFGESSSVQSVRLRNLTSAPLTVSIRLVASESAPAGQPAIQGTPALVLRGALRTNDFTYGTIPLGGAASHSWILAPQGSQGSEVEVAIGLNRLAMTGERGGIFAGILRLTDSLGLSQVEVPVTATKASEAGLWVGRAVVSEVGSYLKTYARDAGGQPVLSSNGTYIVTQTNTSLGQVSRVFPLQLLVHNPEGTGSATLLQQVYCGLDAATNTIVATSEAALDRRFLDTARRLSSAHLPWTEANQGWAFNGNLETHTLLTAIVTLDYADQASNPFLHSYHPDHDNRDASFQAILPQGAESYSVRREITLALRSAGTDFASLTQDGRMLQGDYAEVITVLGLARSGNGPDTRRFEVRGTFVLNRLLPVSSLTRNP